MRRDLHVLVGLLREIDVGIDLSLTTNGFFLTQQAQDLARAGLRRINVSVDSLRRERFAQTTRRDALPQVLEGLAAARPAGRVCGAGERARARSPPCSARPCG